MNRNRARPFYTGFRTPPSATSCATSPCSRASPEETAPPGSNQSPTSSTRPPTSSSLSSAVPASRPRGGFSAAAGYGDRTDEESLYRARHDLYRDEPVSIESDAAPAAGPRGTVWRAPDSSTYASRAASRRRPYQSLVVLVDARFPTRQHAGPACGMSRNWVYYRLQEHAEAGRDLWTRLSVM